MIKIKAINCKNIQTSSSAHDFNVSLCCTSNSNVVFEVDELRCLCVGLLALSNSVVFVSAIELSKIRPNQVNVVNSPYDLYIERNSPQRHYKPEICIRFCVRHPNHKFISSSVATTNKNRTFKQSNALEEVLLKLTKI